MSSETIPEWAMEEGLRLANDSELSLVTYESSGSEIEEATKSDAEAIARALLAAEQRGLEKAATLIEQGYDRPVATPWSANGASKNDLCPHGMAVYQDCEQCAAAAIRSLGEKI